MLHSTYLITAYEFALLVELLQFQLTFLPVGSTMGKELQNQVLFSVTRAER